jgi:hypothetical protein
MEDGGLEDGGLVDILPSGSLTDTGASLWLAIKYRAPAGSGTWRFVIQRFWLHARSPVHSMIYPAASRGVFSSLAENAPQAAGNSTRKRINFGNLLRLKYTSVGLRTSQSHFQSKRDIRTDSIPLD